MAVSGRVQGVFFRDNVRRKAQEIGLKGYVRNLPDGSVEIAAEGSREKLEELAEFCKKSPGHSKVDRVEARLEDGKGELDNEEFNGFEVRH